MPYNDCGAYTVREEARDEDAARVRALAASLDMFTDEEVRVAEELVLERLDKGEASGYAFIFLETRVEDGVNLAGYACFGRVPCTLRSWDLYWIAVDKELQGKGLGRRLLRLVEEAVRASGGERLYAETSSLPRYAPTREFYRRTGFMERARFPEFYAPGDDKVVYEKEL